MKFNNIVKAIGRTPLVKLNKLPGSGSATVYAKMESFNPCHSVKDRIGLAMIEAADDATEAAAPARRTCGVRIFHRER